MLYRTMLAMGQTEGLMCSLAPFVSDVRQPTLSFDHSTHSTVLNDNTWKSESVLISLADWPWQNPQRSFLSR